MPFIAYSSNKISSPLKIHAPPPNYKFSYKTTVNNTTIMTDKSLKSLVSLKLLNTHTENLHCLFIYATRIVGHNIAIAATNNSLIYLNEFS